MTSAYLVWGNLRRQPARALLAFAAVTSAFALYGLALGITAAIRTATLVRGLEVQPGVAAVAIGVTGIGLLPILGLTIAGLMHGIRGRASELALLKALGFSHLRIVSLLVAETAVPCVAGAALGLVGAKLIFRLLVATLPALDVMPAPEYSAALLVSALCLAMLVALVSAVLPVWPLRGKEVVTLLRDAPALAPRAIAEDHVPAPSAAPDVSPLDSGRRPAVPVDLQLLNQVAVATRIGLSTLRVRMRGVLLVVGSIAAIVFLLLLPLSALESIRVAINSSGDPARVVVRSRTGVLLDQSHTPDGLAEMLTHVPGVAKSRTGAPLIDTETFGWPFGLVIRDSGKKGHSPLVGIGPLWTEMTPTFRLLSGRLPLPENRELLAGTLAWQKFSNLAVGTVTFGGEEWRVVGTFTTGDWWDGYLVGNAAEIQPLAPPSAGRAIRLRLNSPDAFDDFRKAIAERLPPSLVVERETEHYADFWRRVPKHLFYIVLVLATLISTGAALGTTLVMESALEDRRRELATLRLLGFESLAVAVALLIEALVLALTGALTGTALAWAVLDGRIMNGAWGVLRVDFDHWLVLFAVGWGAGIALAGASVLVLRLLRSTVLEAIQDLWRVCTRRGHDFVRRPDRADMAALPIRTAPSPR